MFKVHNERLADTNCECSYIWWLNGLSSGARSAGRQNWLLIAGVLGSIGSAHVLCNAGEECFFVYACDPVPFSLPALPWTLLPLFLLSSRLPFPIFFLSILGNVEPLWLSMGQGGGASHTFMCHHGFADGIASTFDPVEMLFTWAKSSNAMPVCFTTDGFLAVALNGLHLL